MSTKSIRSVNYSKGDEELKRYEQLAIDKSLNYWLKDEIQFLFLVLFPIISPPSLPFYRPYLLPGQT